MAKAKVTIQKDPDNEVEIKILEQSIVDVANAAKQLLESRLSERAIILLVQDLAGPNYVTKGQVKDVLRASSRLTDFLK